MKSPTFLIPLKAEYARNPKKVVTIGLLVVVGLYAVYRYTSSPVATTTYSLVKVERQTLTSYVSSAGQIIVKNQIDLKPQSSNTITSIRVGVGSSVKSGQVLATLDSRAALISLKQAEASLLSAKASFKKVQEGATPSDLLSMQSSLDNSKNSLITAKQTAVSKINETAILVSDVLTTKTNTFFSSPNTSPILSIPNYPLNNQVLQSSVENDRRKLLAAVPGWKITVNALTIDGDIQAQLSQSLDILNSTAQYLDDLLTALNANTSSDATVSGYRSTVSSARSSVSSQISAIIAQQQALVSAQSQVSQNQASYDLKKSPPTEDDVTIAQASLTNAEASYLNAQNNYANTVITAPFDAVVGAVSGKVGDSASAGTSMFTLITSTQQADISLNEVDATKIRVGQKATLTFDAVPDLVVAGTVGEVSPLGAVSAGVVSYGIKVNLDTLDARIKPGMSVNANIITEVKENVLSVPNEAVKTQARSSYVEVPASPFTSASTTPVTSLPEAPVKSQVTVGISNDSDSEIVSGLSEGDWVITKTNTSSLSTSRTASTQQSGFSALGGGGGARGVGR